MRNREVGVELMTEKLFQTVYTNKETRNSIAYPTTCKDKNGVFKYKKACLYPMKYIVEDHHIDLAKKEKERAKKETLKTNKNKLLFVGMGLTFEVGSENEINNHRIRTIFINNMNQKIMVEVVTEASSKKSAYISHSILIKGKKQEHNRRDVEISLKFPYTKEGLLSVINSYDCSFNEVVIDSYDIGCISSDNEAICKSPNS